VIDTKIPTLNMESSGKYTWRPDRMPRLAEYVADFARAGERALGEVGRTLLSVRSDASRRKAMRRFDLFQRTVALLVGMDRQECLSYLNASGQVAWRCSVCTTWAARSTRRRDGTSASVSSLGLTG